MTVTEPEPRTPVAKVTPYQRRKPEVAALAASATRIRGDDKTATAAAIKRRRNWQIEAWRYFHEIGEIGFTVAYLADAVSRLRLFVAARPDPEKPPVPVDDPESGVAPDIAAAASDALARLQGERGGQGQILRELEANLEVAGEGYLHGQPPTDGVFAPDGTVIEEAHGERWQVHSINELVGDAGQFALREAPGEQPKPVGAADLCIRMWTRDPEYSGLAYSAMVGVLSECETLMILSRGLRAGGKSILSNGILLIPSELSFNQPARPGSAATDGSQPERDPFLLELGDSMITPITDDGAPSAVVPMVIRGPAEFLEKVRHLPLSREIDGVIDQRIEKRLTRIANGLNVPLEVVLGHMNTTYANAQQIDEDTFDDHIEPRARILCDLLTYGYLRPALTTPDEAGVPTFTADDIAPLFVWFDASDLVSHPGQGDEAKAAHEAGVISAEARRRYTGFSDADAPSDSEQVRNLLTSGRWGDFIAAQLLAATGLVPDIAIPAPPAGVDPGPGPSVLPAPDYDPDAVTAAQAELADIEAAAGLPVETETMAEVAAAYLRREAGHRQGSKLVAIDRALRDRLEVAADRAMKQTLSRAGAKLRGKVRGEMAQVVGDTPNWKVASILMPEVVARLGFTEAGLVSGTFDELGAEFRSWVAQAQGQARAVIVQTTGKPLSAGTEAQLTAVQAAHADKAADVFVAALERLAGVRLYDPAPSSPPLGETDASMTVPASVVREALAVAGGSQPVGSVTASPPPVIDVVGDPVFGVATGPDIMGAYAAEGGGLDSYVWDYGPAIRRPFEPHVALDGVVFTDFDDDQLANDEGWPDVPFYLPGDHDGCCCDLTPVLVDAADMGADQQQQGVDLAAVDEAVGADPAVEAEVAAEATVEPDIMAIPEPEPVATEPLRWETTADADAWAHALREGWWPSLSPGENEAMRDYIGSGYKIRNYLLRHGEERAVDQFGLTNEALQVAHERNRLLAEAMDRMPSPDRVVVYRGAAGFEVPSVGTEFVDNGFVSTSVSRRFSADWVSGRTDAMLFVLDVPAGTPIGPIAGREHEVILKPGLRFVVDSVRRYGRGPVQVSAHVVP